MGFRILRLHGYTVSSNCIEQFKSAGTFFSFAGESRHGVTEMLNLYRASQLRFPGETILEESHAFSKAYLENALQSKDVIDEWALKKDLKGEVEYALKFPWHRNPPRLETRQYLQQYGTHDAWLGKTIHRLYNVNNPAFLELAKADFNRSQAFHQKELQQISRWWNESGFTKLSFARQRAAESYFAIAACIFEPKFSSLRLSCAKSGCICIMLDDLFDNHGSVSDLRLFLEAMKRWDPTVISDLSEEIKICFNGLYNEVNFLVEDVFKVQGVDISQYIRTNWTDLICAHMVEAEWSHNKHVPIFDEYIENAKVTCSLNLVILHSIFFCGELLPDDILQQVDFRSKFMQLVCLTSRLTNDIQTFQAERERGELASCISCYMKENPSASEEEAIAILYGVMDHAFKELNWELLQPSTVPRPCKRILFEAARIMQVFYMVRDGLSISNKEMKEHLQDILFEPISV